MANSSQLHQGYVNSETNKSTYQYEPLTQPDAIRILRVIEAEAADCEICTELIEKRLSDVPIYPYTALSYAWGSFKDNTHPLYIGTEYIYIGSNLDSAIRHLRRKDCSIYIWVDAVCINQPDVTERNHQVQQMRDVYLSAEETIIYLGDQDGGNTGLSAWNFLERHSTWAMNENQQPDPDRPIKLDSLTQFRGDLADVELDILRRPWFGRLWVFQEVVVSTRLSIQCGNRRISWDDFCRTLLLSHRYHDPYGFSLGHTDRVAIVKDMFHARCIYQELYGRANLLPAWRAQIESYKSHSLDILDMLQRGRRLAASDPRDKIYGLLGISAGISVDDKRFAIDYNQSCRQLYTAFARNIMQVMKSYDILSYLDHGSVNTSEFGFERDLLANKHKLPWWVPNWDRSWWSDWPTHRIARTILSTLKPESDSERKARETLMERSCAWIDAGDVLVACGTVLGRIKEVGPVITLEGRDERAFQTIRDDILPTEPKVAMESILAQWQLVFSKPSIPAAPQSRLRGHHLNRRPTARNFPEFNKLFGALADSSIVPPPEGSVEHHLFLRARQTVAWSDDRSPVAALITDESSVVDGKRVAVCEWPKGEASGGTLHGQARATTMRLALVPGGAVPGDFLVAFRAARVPFAVHFMDRAERLFEGVTAWRLVDFSLRVCQIIGECVVNGYDSTPRVTPSDRSDRVFMVR